MKKSEFIIRATVRSPLLYMLLFLLLMACDDPNTASSNIQSASAAVTADTDTGELIPMTVEKTVLEDSIDKTVSINWIHEDAKSAKIKVNALLLKLTNYLDMDLSAHVTVRFSGLLMEVATLDLGTVTLHAKGETTLSVSSDDLPLQTTTGVCQAGAFMEVTGDGDYRAAAGSEALYYRHLPNYKGAQIFGEKIFLKEDKGKFFDIGKSTRTLGLKAAASESLGRVRNAKGKFEEITAAKKGLLYTAERGDPVIVTRMSFGEAPLDPEQELKEMNNEDK